MSAPSLWGPVVRGATGRVLTSAELREEGDHDTVSLFFEGELAVEFNCASGLGAAFLAECGLEKRE